MIAQLSSFIPAAAKGSLWLPVQASTSAEEIDSAWWLVYWVSVFFFVIVVAVLALFLLQYYRRRGHKAQLTPNHHYPLELTWSILPAFIVAVLFVKGVDGFIDMRTPPADTYDIQVIAKQWSWTFIYPNGIISPELHVPIDENVKLIMSSDDVIHSLFIPAFRVKQDIVPGRYNYLWFNAIMKGEFDLYCAEYCGTNHSEMITHCYVHDKEGLATWFEEEVQKMLSMPPIELGEKLYTERGCSQCHQTDTGTLVGPGFAQTYGNAHKFTDGTSLTVADANENYIRESIVNPQAKVREGFPPTMPTYKGMLRPAELRGLVAFVKAQNPKYREEAQTQFAKPASEMEKEQPADGEESAGGESLENPADEDVAPDSGIGEPTDVRE